MKRKYRLLSLLLSLAVLLTFMPAMAFADEDKATTNAATRKVIGIEYNTDTDSAYGPIGDSYFDYGVKGAKITLTYSNGDSEDFLYDDDEDCFIYTKNGEQITLDEEPIYTDVEGGFLEKGENNGYLKYVVYSDNDEDEYEYIESNRFNVEGKSNPDINSVSYIQNNGPWKGKFDFYDLSVSYENEDNLLGDQIIVKRNQNDEDDNPVAVEETYTYKLVKDEDGDESGRFVLDGNDDEFIYPTFIDDQKTNKWEPGTTKEVRIFVDGFEAGNTATVNVEDVVLPESVEFVPAAGFGYDYCYLGSEDLGTWELSGSGNKFVVKLSNGKTKEYYYNSKVDEFTLGGAANTKDVFAAWAEIPGGLKKGTQKVTYTYYYNDGNHEGDYEFPFSVNVTADKYGTNVDIYDYTYTGKVINPKVVVRTNVGRKLSSKEYSYTKPKNKNVGVYEITVNIKDKANYESPAWGFYTIKPKAVKAKKIKAGKRKLTISWKKLSKAERKQVDGFRIIYSTDKKFKTYKTTYASKKSGSKTIKKLKSKKKYYVRIYAYKKVKKWGETITLSSIKASKTKSVKVK